MAKSPETSAPRNLAPASQEKEARSFTRLDREPQDWNYDTDRLRTDSNIVIVGNDAGGVGKSLTAQFMALVMEDNTEDYRFIECETQPRMSALFKEKAIFHEYDQTGQEVDPDASSVYWDALAVQLTRTSNCVVDLTANAVKNFLRWADLSGEVYLRDGRGLTFVCVTTSEEKALNASLPNLLGFKHAFPEARLVLLLNSMHGPLRPTDKAVEALRKETGAEVYELPRLVAPAWDSMKRLGRFDVVSEMTTEDLIRRKVDPGKASRSIRAFRSFCSEVEELIETILFPQRAKPEAVAS